MERANKPVIYAKLLQDIYAGKQVACPLCGAKGLKYKLCADPATRVGFAQFKCESCGIWEHLSRVKFAGSAKFESLMK